MNKQTVPILHALCSPWVQDLVVEYLKSMKGHGDREPEFGGDSMPPS